MLQLRRITDQVLNRHTAEQVAGGMEQVRQRGHEIAHKAYERGNEAARIAYDYAMNHRKATTAVVLGAGIAAALLWMVQRNGGYAAMRKKVIQRVKGTASSKTRSRRRVTQAAA